MRHSLSDEPILSAWFTLLKTSGFNRYKYGMRKALLTLAVLLAIGVAIIAASRSSGQLLPGKADYILVEKQKHTLTLFRNGAVLKIYSVALGRGGLMPKIKSGDNKVPEGVYRIVSRNPQSAFHLALRVGYPTPAQIQSASSQGIDPGGDIMVHGIRNGFGWIGKLHRHLDWTKGCVAVTDEEIEEIWNAVTDGTPIEIRP